MHVYKLGDPAWIFLTGHQGDRTKGKVVAVLNLDGWDFPHYVVEIENEIESLLEVRCAPTMRHSDPRIDRIAQIIRADVAQHGIDIVYDFTSAARKVLEEIE